MPHQCLRCGSVFADGSPQILRGCPDCGGTRFFFTEKRMSDEERNELKEKANKDIKHFIQEMLAGETPPIRIEGESSGKEEWVPLGIISEAEPEEVNAHGRSEVEKRIVKSIEDLKFPKEGRFSKLKFASKRGVKKEPEKAAVEEKVSQPKPEEPKKEERVAVITIKDEGVYEIDVEKLLEDSPMIVKKDGSYMVHLPSVFKKIRKKGSAA